MASYRDLMVWQRAHENLLDILHLVDDFPNTRVAWEIERQLVRSAGSIGANIAEGQGRHRFGRRMNDRQNFFEIAYGSATETDNWLQVIADVGWVDRDRIRVLQARNEEVMRMLYVFVVRSGAERDAPAQTSDLKAHA